MAGQLFLGIIDILDDNFVDGRSLGVESLQDLGPIRNAFSQSQAIVGHPHTINQMVVVNVDFQSFQRIQ